jgi:hypothetical protein
LQCAIAFSLRQAARDIYEIALGISSTKRYRYFWKYTDDSFVEQGILISYYVHSIDTMLGR